MSIIQAVREYLLTYPGISESDALLLVDYLGSEAGQFTIEPVPCDPIFQKYADGGCQKQYLFLLASREEYSAALLPCVKNEQFYEDFARWIEVQNAQRVLPDLGVDRFAVGIEVITGGYVLGEDADTARYQIQLRLVYEEEFPCLSR